MEQQCQLRPDARAVSTIGLLALRGATKSTDTFFDYSWPLGSIERYAPQVLLFGEIGPSWALAQPLLLDVRCDEDGYFVVSSEQFLVHGDGWTAEEAIEDYKSSLIEYYLMVAERAVANPCNRILLERLQLYLIAV